MHQKRRTNNMGGGGSNGGQHRHNNNRPRRFNNNRPQGGEGGGGDAASVARTRRNATQNREKYQMMARDALAQGDRVLAENWLQHSDHYHRVILSLPPEEIPRAQYLPGHGPNEGQQQPQADGQPNNGGSENNHSDHNQPQHHQDVHHQDGAGAGLPSFITQPMDSGNSDDRG